MILEPKNKKSVTVSMFPPFAMKWWDRMPWSSFSEYWVLSLFSPLLFHPHQEVLFPSSLSAIRVVSSAYLRLLIFLPAILIPAYDSSNPAFLMMYSAYKSNKQSNNIQPCRTAFPILNQSVVQCKVLIVASWPAYISSRSYFKFFWVYTTNLNYCVIW